MSYDIKIFRKKDFQVSTWSGGTTTQLAIYPEDSDYSEKNFLWRISSAKVEIEQSVFTSLPGIKRVIMVIEGVLVLEHEGHHSTVLKSFDQDTFCGSWQTKSYGKVTDFNLMMAKGCEGFLDTIHLNENDEKQLSIIRSVNKNDGFSKYIHALYCTHGQISLGDIGKKGILNAGDMALLEIKDYKSDDDIVLNIINTKQKASLIRAIIRY